MVNFSSGFAYLHSVSGNSVYTEFARTEYQELNAYQYCYTKKYEIAVALSRFA